MEKLAENDLAYFYLRHVVIVVSNVGWNYFWMVPFQNIVSASPRLHPKCPSLLKSEIV
jgi:hypothetical protein